MSINKLAKRFRKAPVAERPYFLGDAMRYALGQVVAGRPLERLYLESRQFCTRPIAGEWYLSEQWLPQFLAQAAEGVKARAAFLKMGWGFESALHPSGDTEGFDVSAIIKGVEAVTLTIEKRGQVAPGSEWASRSGLVWRVRRVVRNKYELHRPPNRIIYRTEAQILRNYKNVSH